MTSDLSLAKEWAAIFGNQVVSRPTERAAFALWEHGWINLPAYFGDTYAIPYWARKRVILDVVWLDQKQRTHQGAIGRVCIDCGERKPVTDFYRDVKSKAGRHHKCKACSRDYQREHYTSRRAVDPQHYARRLI